MREIAIYGKGGIGKSTLTSNLSAALAECGSRVLQIGCDPKHDSTRLLMHGKRIITVLDYIRDTATLKQKKEDILFEGYLGTGCIEAGGPKPGVGCAGRGIITAFELLDRFHIKENYDIIMYDVLGDVVCGGFAVPIRREYANEIFIVTSGEYMSIYAANNILRGINNYGTDVPRVAGIIYNSRNVKGELARVQKFASAVGLPVFAEVPRSEVFAECERANMTAVEAANQNQPLQDISELSGIFQNMAARIIEGIPLYNASPLTDEELESLIMGTEFLENISNSNQNADTPSEGIHINSGETAENICTTDDKSSKLYASEADSGKKSSDLRESDAAIHINSKEMAENICTTDGKSSKLYASEADSGKKSSDLHESDAAIHINSSEMAENICTPDDEFSKLYASDDNHTDNNSDNNAGNHTGNAASHDKPLFSKNVIRDEPLHGCAFNGAACMSVHINDAKILLHSPKSCAYISWQTISSTGRRELYERGSILPAPLLPGLESTNMTESDMVFGGTDKLTERVSEIVNSKEHPKALIVISACPSGIIGDDIDRAKLLSTPDCPVITVKADGNLTGDYMQGMLMAYTELAKQIIDPKVEHEPDTVNIVFEKVVIKNAEDNFSVIKSFLDRMNIKVNCRFLYDTTFDSVKNFCKAELNLLAYKDFTGNILEKFFTENYGAKFFDKQFPVGYKETSEWVRGIGAAFGKEDIAEEIIEENREKYYSRIREIKPLLEGKKLMIITFNHELDWILQAALDCGMEIVKLCILNYSQDEGFRTSIPEVRKLNIVEDYDREQRVSDIETLKPDIVLGNYTSDKLSHEAVLDTIPMCPDVGFFSGLAMVKRWSTLVKSDNEGEWENDRRLFEKYYA